MVMVISILKFHLVLLKTMLYFDFGLDKNNILTMVKSIVIRKSDLNKGHTKNLHVLN